MGHPTRRDLMRLGLGSMVGLAWPTRNAAAPANGGLVQYGNPRRYTVTHKVAVTNGDVPLSSLEAWIPVPQNQPEQDVGEVTVSPKVDLVPDVTGQALVARRHAVSGLPSAGQGWSLEVSYELTCRQIMANWAALRQMRLPAYRKGRQVELFTRPEKYIETESREIAERAKKLAGHGRDPISVARAVYEWVLEHTAYKLIEGVGGAAYCMKNGHGECGDYSALFVALCRAAGIPARPVTGFWADKTNGWHVWAEFMLPGGQWLPVDASIGDQNAFSRQLYFGSLDNRRVALCKTLDIVLVGKRVGQMKADFLQTGCFWWHSGDLRPGARQPTVEFTAQGQPAKA
jgi:hypothetical protein